mgnify:CR=1 FL=1
MNGRDLESSELGLPGENVETPIAIRAPRVKKDVWLAAAAEGSADAVAGRNGVARGV